MSAPFVSLAMERAGAQIPLDREEIKLAMQDSDDGNPNSARLVESLMNWLHPPEEEEIPEYLVVERN